MNSFEETSDLSKSDILIYKNSGYHKTKLKNLKEDIVLSTDQYLIKSDVYERIKDFDFNKVLSTYNVIQNAKDAHNISIKVFKKIIKKFCEHNITYCLTFGTLLGFVRNKKIIPYDDDIDIEIKEADAYKLNQIDWGPDIKYMGWGNNGGLYMIFDAESYTKYGEQNGIKIDIFSEKSNDPPETIHSEVSDGYGGGYYHQSLFRGNIRNLPGISNCVIDSNLIFPLKKDFFEDIEVFVPAEPEIIVKKLYGGDCITNCKVYNHKFNNSFHKEFDKDECISWEPSVLYFISQLNIKFDKGLFNSYIKPKGEY